MKKLIKYLLLLLFIAGLSITGCTDFLTPSVDQNVETSKAVSTPDQLQNTVNGGIDILTSLYGNFTFYGRDFPVTNAVSSDNAYSTGNSGRQLNQDQLQYTPSSGYPNGVWRRGYQAIKDENLAIKQSSQLDSSPEVDNIVGQAHAWRALLHMDILMSFGQQYVNGGGESAKGVPYITDYHTDTHGSGDLDVSRPNVSEDWNKIGADFAQAVQLMDSTRSQSFDNTHMNYWAARGLQSRYYLYHQKWDSVKIAAKDIIDNGPFNLVSAANYNQQWLSGTGPQSLFEFSFISTDKLTFANIASLYRVVGTTTYHDVVVTPDLYNIYGDNDVRRNLYAVIGGLVRMDGKYHDITGLDNVRLIRYAEVLLNYAEALARTGEQDKALQVINNIASHRNADSYSAGTVENVLLERRKELAMEGFRFFDLLRNKKPIVPGDPNSGLKETLPVGNYRRALPIPRHETDSNPNITQNQGYQ